MVRTKSIYLKLCLLTAALLVAGAASNCAFAFDYDGPDDAALTADSPAPSLAGQNSTGFALESPAEAGAQPITPTFGSPFVLPLPRAVAPFPIRLNRAVRRYVSDLLNQPDHLQDTFDRSQCTSESRAAHVIRWN